MKYAEVHVLQWTTVNYTGLHQAYLTFELINNKRLEYSEVRCRPAVDLAEVRRTRRIFPRRSILLYWNIQFGAGCDL